jgi:uncharacterized membrane protein
MSDALSDDPQDIAQARSSKNRIEALTDGIYAVAMTLLVIDLKVPEPHGAFSQDEFDRGLLLLLPKVGAWVISFLVLANFWIGHHRLFQHVRVVDAKLLWRNLFQLMLVSLLPFSASLIGEYVFTREAQYVYNINMILLSLASIWQVTYVHKHPDLQARRMTNGAYHASLIGLSGLVAAAIIAIGIAVGTGSIFATYAYLLMWPLGILRRRVAARDLAVPVDGPSGTHPPPPRP